MRCNHCDSVSVETREILGRTVHKCYTCNRFSGPAVDRIHFLNQLDNEVDEAFKRLFGRLEVLLWDLELRKGNMTGAFLAELQTYKGESSLKGSTK